MNIKVSQQALMDCSLTYSTAKRCPSYPSPLYFDSASPKEAFPDHPN